MKRIIASILSFIMICTCLAACSEKSEEKTTADITADITTEETVFDGSAAAVSSEHYTITNAMLSYFFYSGYYSEMSQYGSMYQQYYGLDTSKSLREQEYAEGKTWYSYFLDNAKTNASDVLHLLEAAREEGKENREIDTSDIDAFISGLKSQAESDGASLDDYLIQYFGKGVTEDVIRSALEMYTRAYTYYEDVYKAMDYTDEECREYFEENKSEFMLCDYYSYTFSAQLPEDDGTSASTDADEVDTADPDVIAAYEDAKQKAQALASHSGSAEDFGSELKKLLIADYEAENPGEPITDEIIEELVEDRLTEGAKAIGEDNERVAWTSGDRKAGDTKVIDSGSGRYTVYCIVKPAYRQEYVTKNVRHILFDTDNYESSDEAKAACDAVYAELESGTDKSQEHFAEVAKEKSQDTGSKANGGLYENVVRGTMVAEFEDWLYDEARAVGDIGIVESSYGYHIMYFVGDGDIAWINTAKSSLRVNELQELEGQYAEKYKLTVSDNIPYFMD